MSGYLDLENYTCRDVLNRPDLAGVVDRTKSERPWFRSFLPRALDLIQKPYYTNRDGKRELLWDGSWRGMELAATPDPTYGSVNTDGIAYPVGYRNMKYVYLVGSDGKVSSHPLPSETEEQRNTQEKRDRYPWYGFVDWDFWGWDDACRNHSVKWMDKNGKFYLTHTPQQTLTLRMTYYGYATAPTDAQYTANFSDWFTANLFTELGALVEAMMWRAAGEDDNAQRTMTLAEEVIGNAWRLNQAQKAGSNSRIFIPLHAPSINSQRGW